MAQEEVREGLEKAEQTGLPQEDVRIIIANVIRVFLGVLGTIALVLFFYAGYLWMTSAGKEEQMAKAKDIMKNTSIGLLIILSAYAIVTFIIGLLIEVTGSGQSSYDQSEALARGALGAGVIQSHYPARDAVGVPRNTNIIITFKVPIAFESVASWTEDDTDSDGDGKVRDWSDEYRLIPEAVSVMKKESKDTYSARVYVIESEFREGKIKTIVIDPDAYLGSENENMEHQVALLAPLRMLSGDAPFRLTPYVWTFETGTLVDFDPPKIQGMETPPLYGDAKPAEQLTAKPSTKPAYKNLYEELYNQKRTKAEAIPFPYETVSPCNSETHDSQDSCKRWPRNVLIQIHFSEALNPITAAGRTSFLQVYRYTPSEAQPWTPVSGEFRLSSDYRTAEFWSDEAGGSNSCGDTVYVLPANAVIRVLAQAAAPDNADPNNAGYSPQVPFPWNGIVDVADNALDGNADGYATAKSPAEADNFPVSSVDYDDFFWSFDTSDTLDLTSPIITKLTPLDHAGDVGGREPMAVHFSKLMSATTLLPNDTIYTRGKEDPADAGSDVTQWSMCLPQDEGGCPVPGTLISYIATSLQDVNKDGTYESHSATLVHESFQKNPATFFNPVVSKGVKDLFQNCYEGACVGIANPTPQSVDANYVPGDDPLVDPANPMASGCTQYLPNPLSTP